MDGPLQRSAYRLIGKNGQEEHCGGRGRREVALSSRGTVNMTDTTNTQKTNRLIVAAILIGMSAFAYSSFDARLRLRSEMPKDFVDNSKSIPASERSREEKLARAYWKCALSVPV